jgi:predicted aldo/keto reductase-like oxidoreductase
LGRTGETVSVIGVGGSHIGQVPSEELAIQIIRTAIDHGINFMDNSWDYNGGTGADEIRMGKALRDGYRQKVFLMTKVDGRTKEAAASQLDESLKRLEVDHIDLLQFHEVIRMEDPDRFFADGGALEAFLDARKAGKISFIGFTGHKDPAIHLRMLSMAREGVPFRCRSIPLQCDGLELPQFCASSDAASAARRDRRPDDEADGRQIYPGGQYRHAGNACNTR